MKIYYGVNSRYFSKFISEKTLTNCEPFSTLTFTKLNKINSRVDFIKMFDNYWVVFSNCEPFTIISNYEIFSYILGCFNLDLFDIFYTDLNYFSPYNILQSSDENNLLLRKELNHYE